MLVEGEALAVAWRRRSKRAIDPYTVYGTCRLYGKGEYGDADGDDGWLVGAMPMAWCIHGDTFFATTVTQTDHKQSTVHSRHWHGEDCIFL